MSFLFLRVFRKFLGALFKLNAGAKIAAVSARECGCQKPLSISFRRSSRPLRPRRRSTGSRRAL